MAVAGTAVGVANLGVVDASGRHARNLVFYPAGNKVQIQMGVGIPLQLPHQAVTTGFILKSNYRTPSNATMYTRPQEYFSSRSARAAANAPDAGGLTEHLASRWDLYTALQGTLEQLGGGAGSGRQCLLRAVCEAAAFTVRHDGLLGELLHVLLTPSTTSDPMRQRQDAEFHAAEAVGRQARSAEDPVDACARTFRGCATSALDLFTRVMSYY
ncbi:uncharacterized protein LOC117644694 [Thrips palmi]|uniref:Uncharacterized protein LOC117644694 n=1 Tax=Thrips palmi TaxID=161013 RepID=A0A6P8ZM92_THRPL|nr:uncharacterized protein LOC117644694 [Thrips palmi]